MNQHVLIRATDVLQVLTSIVISKSSLITVGHLAPSSEEEIDCTDQFTEEIILL